MRTCYCIDMKTFYASVECAERGLNPFETPLVVADTTRGSNALCLAVSPKLKAMGIKNRCRLSEIPSGWNYITAPPRMQKYIDYAADIYALYLDYFDPADIHVYSIDEAFIEATGYLSMYRTDGETLAKHLMGQIAEKLHIPSTAGVGTNLYLAKIALDITAKHTKEHIGILNEQSYRDTLWDHRPLTDFWQIARGTAERLAHRGIFTMRGIAAVPEELLYKIFGVNAELLIDHAWGRESCLISDIKQYKGKSKSVSSSQILPRNYTAAEAETVLREMAQQGCRELLKRHVIGKKVTVMVGYAGEEQPPAQGSARLSFATALPSLFVPAAVKAYREAVNPLFPVRRLGICFCDVTDENAGGYDLFTDWEAMDKEKRGAEAALQITERFGKNALLRGTSLKPEATARERNMLIGGHRAGYDDTGGAGEAVHALRCDEGLTGGTPGPGGAPRPGGAA